MVVFVVGALMAVVALSCDGFHVLPDLDHHLDLAPGHGPYRHYGVVVEESGRRHESLRHVQGLEGEGGRVDGQEPGLRREDECAQDQGRVPFRYRSSAQHGSDHNHGHETDQNQLRDRLVQGKTNEQTMYMSKPGLELP